MTEELFVKIGSVWRELELQRPSGITFEFKSTLFSDITKVTSNKTYTFTLPGTAKNNLTLQNLSDLRHTSKVLGAKLPCIYKINGMNFINNPNLYISQVAKDKSYKAVMSWGGVIMEEDVNLNELKEGSVVIFKEDWMDPNPGKWANFNSNADDVIYPWYSCGVPTHNLYVTETYTIEGQEGEYYTRTSAPPLPVISVYNILTEIEKRYALKFDFKKQYTKTQWENGTDNGGCDIVNKGVIPITGLNVNDKDLQSYKLTLSQPQVYIKLMSSVGGAFGWLSFVPVFATKIQEKDTYIKTLYETFTYSGGDKISGYSKFGLSPAVRGSFKVTGKLVCKTDKHFSGDIVMYLKNTSNNTEEELEIQKTDNTITLDLTGENALTLEDYGYYEFELKANVPNESTVYYEGSIDMQFIMPSVMDMDISRPIKPWTLLPEISCKDFVKSLFYIAGGFPVVNSDGSIGLAFFNDIKKNMQSGKIYNWTDYLLNKKDYTVKYSDGSLGINNYYLMKNESLEKTKDKEEDDVYNSHFARLSCDNMSLPTQKTICTLPYFTQYIKDSVNPDLETGNTFKFYRWRNGKLETVEAKPSIGVLTKETNRFLEGVLIWNTLGMETWQFPQDLEHDERYAYFAKIIKNPQYVECTMSLPIFVLKDIDFAKPIYIEQFNSMFVATDIRYTSKTGVSTVNLIKIPTN